MPNYQPANPLDKNHRHGRHRRPGAAGQRDALHRLGTEAEGAKLLAGGEQALAPVAGGCYVQPTIFDGVTNQHDDRARGDLRPGADRCSAFTDAADVVQAGQQQHLRVAGRRLDPRHQQGARRGARAARRHRARELSTTRTTSPCPSVASSRAAWGATSRCTRLTSTPSARRPGFRIDSPLCTSLTRFPPSLARLRRLEGGRHWRPGESPFRERTLDQTPRAGFVRC